MHMYDVCTVYMHIHINLYLFTGKYTNYLCKDMETPVITGCLQVGAGGECGGHKDFPCFKLIKKGSERRREKETCDA